MALLRRGVVVEEGDPVHVPELGPLLASFNAGYVSRGWFVFLSSIALIDTIVLHDGIARLWSLSAVQPVDGSSKGFTIMLIVTGKKMAELPIPLGSPVFAVVVHLAEFGAPVGCCCIGFDDAVRLDIAGAKTDSFTRVPLAKAL